jgi:hypothetical protein
MEYDRSHVPCLKPLAVGSQSAEELVALCQDGAIPAMQEAVAIVLSTDARVIAQQLAKKSAELFQRIQPEEVRLVITTLKP